MALKPFEKWFEKSGVIDTRKGYCRDAWIAALEWAEDRISESSGIGDALSKIIKEIESKYNE